MNTYLASDATMSDITNNLKLFRPDDKLVRKYNIFALLTTVGVIILFAAFFGSLGFFEEVPELIVVGIILIAITLLTYFSLLYYFVYYVKNLEYNVLDEEVHQKVGVFLKAERVVPYRQITNIEIKHGIIDRYLGIGRVEIQTAGFTNPSMGPEISMTGIKQKDLQLVRDTILERVKMAKS